jgi:hypothetical protein
MANGTALDGFWLPRPDGLALELGERSFGPGRVPLRIPVLTPHALREVLSHLRANRAEHLAERPVADILDVVESATRRLVEPGDALYEELVETLPDLTGYSRRMIEIGLERMGSSWTKAVLLGALEAEFGAVDVLDDFQPRAAGGAQRAFGPALAVHVFSGNIPGVSVTSLIRALCVKSASLGKTAVGEPLFAACFARALAEEDAGLAGCLGVTYWPGGSDDLEAVAFSEAEAVIAYGSDEAVGRIASRVPSRARFIAYPNRVGAAIVAREALGPASAAALAHKAALDVVTFDQQGCVSPHTIYVERGGEIEPQQFARQLGAALEELSVDIPRGVLAPGESSLIHQLRAQAEMRGAMVLCSEPGTAWTVIVEDREDFQPSPLNRVIQLCPVDDLSRAVSALAQVGGRLQTVAVAAGTDRMKGLTSRLGAAGATRIVSVGEAAWPSAHWHHDGRFQYLDLVRFVDLEF